MTLPSVKPKSSFSVCLTCLECNGTVNWSSCVMTSGDQINPAVDLSCSCRNIARALNKTLSLFTSYSSYSRAFIPSCISLQIVSEVFFRYFFFIHHATITGRWTWRSDEASSFVRAGSALSESFHSQGCKTVKQLTTLFFYLFFFKRMFTRNSFTEAFLLSFRSTHHACFLSPLCPLLSSCQDVEHMLSHRLWSRWPWRGTKGFAGVTSSSPCGLPQPAPSSAQHAGLLSLLHLLPEH